MPMLSWQEQRTASSLQPEPGPVQRSHSAEGRGGAHEVWLGVGSVCSAVSSARILIKLFNYPHRSLFKITVLYVIVMLQTARPREPGL